jgi:hypothetical protein
MISREKMGLVESTGRGLEGRVDRSAREEVAVDTKGSTEGICWALDRGLAWQAQSGLAMSRAFLYSLIENDFIGLIAGRYTSQSLLERR